MSLRYQLFRFKSGLVGICQRHGIEIVICVTVVENHAQQTSAS